MRYYRHMAKTLKQEHDYRTMLIANQLGEEYGKWFGWPEHSPIGRHIALGEYITELCELEPHDEWFDAAKDAYQKWKKVHHVDTTPPPSNR
jgi:hypothetical protein